MLCFRQYTYRQSIYNVQSWNKNENNHFADCLRYVCCDGRLGIAKAYVS